MKTEAPASDAEAPGLVRASAAPKVRTFEAWAEAKGVEKWLVAAASVGKPVGREMRETDFDAEIRRVSSLEMR